MDSRARKFTLFHRKRLRELENEWRSLFPEDREGLFTYTSLAIILEDKPLEDFLNISSENRCSVENDYCHDYKILKRKEKTASSREYNVLTILFWFWIFSVIVHMCLIFSH